MSSATRNPSRRTFLNRSAKTTLGLAAGMTILADPKSVTATPANDKLALAIIGCRGRGNMLAHGFAARDDCEFAWFCDVDREMYATRAKGIAKLQGGRMPHYAMISYRLGGEKLTINPDTERIIGNEQATALLRRTYREPWIVT